MEAIAFLIASRNMTRMTRNAASDHVWSLQDAKARFSELVRRASGEGPQHVTIHGREAVVVISANEFRKMSGSNRTGADLIAAMQACPYPDFEFEFPSVTGPVRDIEF